MTSQVTLSITVLVLAGAVCHQTGTLRILIRQLRRVEDRLLLIEALHGARRKSTEDE